MTRPITVPPRIAAEALVLSLARGNVYSRHAGMDTSKTIFHVWNSFRRAYIFTLCGEILASSQTCVTLNCLVSVSQSHEVVPALCRQMLDCLSEVRTREFTSCEFTIFYKYVRSDLVRIHLHSLLSRLVFDRHFQPRFL